MRDEQRAALRLEFGAGAHEGFALPVQVPELLLLPGGDADDGEFLFVSPDIMRQPLSTLPLSLQLVCELHDHLMRGVRGDHATPGEFRRSQNWIGPQGSTPSTVPYVPPPVVEMMAALGNWETFLHERDTLPDLIQCAVMREQFEAIHPFLDGNGRVGRLLITLFLIERQRLPQPLLYLSVFIEAHRQEYYELLQRVRTHGDWNGWLRWFLRGVEITARDAAQLMAMRESYRG